MGGGNKGKGKAFHWIVDHVAHKGDDCLPWPFSIIPDGYGNLGVSGRIWRAHRFMCVLAHGEAPSPKHHAAHTCHNRACVNPGHLRWSTHSENMLDKRITNTQRANRWGNRGKFTPKQISEIRSLKGKATQMEVARQFDTVRTNIGMIWNGKTHQRAE